MDIENIRYLLTALIQTLPMVYSITIIAFFAIPRSQKKTVVEFLRKTATYLFILTAFTGGTVFATIWVLANLSYFFLQRNSYNLCYNIIFRCINIYSCSLYSIDVGKIFGI